MSHSDIPEPTSAPWERPKLFGYAESLRGLGGIVAPLLTGFALATIALLVTASDKPRLADWATVALSVTAACLLYSMQVAFLALARSPSPGDILNWVPEAAVSVEALTKARAEQAANLDAVRRLWKRTGLAYDIGIVSLLAGLLLLLIPHHWVAATTAAVVVAAAALLGEVWWTVANRIKWLPHPAVRRSDHTPASEPPPLTATGLAAVLDASRTPSE